MRRNSLWVLLGISSAPLADACFGMANDGQDIFVHRFAHWANRTRRRSYFPFLFAWVDYAENSMKPLFDPSLISLDNQMEDFFAEMKRNNERNLEPETDSEADRKFIESMDNIVAANFLMPKKKRFSWAGVIAFLVVAGVVMLLTYWAVEGF